MLRACGLAVSRCQPAVTTASPAASRAWIRTKSAWVCNIPGCRIAAAALAPAAGPAAAPAAASPIVERNARRLTIAMSLPTFAEDPIRAETPATTPG
ncbi:hypothetical protein L3i22_037670 [Actinoplanes sp. L3-i22]|nr:hypothetical protein L3i22_037670 [Actinoplanes sp. L3-i22]